jgi:hypothetical protein
MTPVGEMEGKGRGVEGGVTFLLLTFFSRIKELIARIEKRSTNAVSG